MQEKLLLDAMFEVPGSDVKTVVITDECVKGDSPPEYVRHSTSTTNSTEPPTPPQTTSTEEEESTQVRVKQ